MADELFDRPLTDRPEGVTPEDIPPAEPEPPLRDPEHKPKAKPRRKKAGSPKWSAERRERESKRAKAEAGARPAPSPKVPSDDLANELAGILALPAIPCVLVAPSPEGKMFLGSHFLETGPAVARQLVHYSETNPDLRSKLEALTRVSTTLALVSAAVAYAGPPLLWAFGARTGAMALSAWGKMDESQVQALMGSMVANANGAQHEGAPSPEHPGAETGAPPES